MWIQESWGGGDGGGEEGGVAFIQVKLKPIIMLLQTILKAQCATYCIIRCQEPITMVNEL